MTRGEEGSADARRDAGGWGSRVGAESVAGEEGKKKLGRAVFGTGLKGKLAGSK